MSVYLDVKSGIVTREYKQGRFEISDKTHLPILFLQQQFVEMICANHLTQLEDNHPHHGGLICVTLPKDVWFQSVCLSSQFGDYEENCARSKIVQKLILLKNNQLQRDEKTVSTNFLNAVKKAILKSVAKISANEWTTCGKYIQLTQVSENFCNGVTEIKTFHATSSRYLEFLVTNIENGRFRNVKHLDMQSSNITVHADVLTRLIESLRHLKSLQFLSINYWHMEFEERVMQSVANYISSEHCTLKTLMFHNSTRCGAVKKNLLKSLCDNITIKNLKINLEKGDIDENLLCRLSRLEKVSFDWADNCQGLCDIVRMTQSLRVMFWQPYCLSVNESIHFLDTLLKNTTIVDVTLTWNTPLLKEIIKSNKRMQWQDVNAYLVQFCITLAPLELPPYVLLEIFNWLPRIFKIESNDNFSVMHRYDHRKKIGRIYSVLESFCKIKKHYSFL